MVANRMILLDHLTRGRVMLGVGPGALASDAYMLGIDPLEQRHRMDESLGIIMRLLTETDPITYGLTGLSCAMRWCACDPTRSRIFPWS